MFRHKRFRLATVAILTLLLATALAPAAYATHGGAHPPPAEVPADAGNQDDTPRPGGSNGGGTPRPGGSNGGNGDNGGGTPRPGGGNGGNGNGNGNGGGGGGGMMAPSWPPSNMIVHHAATQVQLAPVNDGLQAYFIAPGGVGHSGPWIESFASLAQKYPTGGAMTLFTGSNQGTGKPINIYYLASEKKIRVSTYYPDTQYDVNKPYVFTVDSGHNVVHDQW